MYVVAVTIGSGSFVVVVTVAAAVVVVVVVLVAGVVAEYECFERRSCWTFLN